MKKKNEIVTVVNDFIDLPLKDFTPSEMNLLTTFLAKSKNQHSNLVEMTFSEIREISKYTSRNNQNLIVDIANTNNKLQTLKFALQTEEGTLKQLVLFPTFEIDPNQKKLSIKVNEDFMYILNDLEFGYTSYEAEIHNGLSSKFSKQAFKQLRRFKSTGVWVITQEKFRELLDIPPKYRQSDIDNRVLKPIKEELTPFFEDLTIEKTYKSVNRGRPSVSGYQFTWNANKALYDGKAEADYVEVEPVDATVTPQKTKRARKSGFNCPYCQEPLYLKDINGNGTEVYVHLDGWKPNAKCSHIFDDVSEIRAAEAKLKFKSDESSSDNGIKPIDEILSKVKEDGKKKKERREEIVKAVPSITNKLANDLFMLLEGYDSVKGGIGEAAALKKIKEHLRYMEDTIENAGFNRDELYEYIFTGDDVAQFRDL